jgi:hypothetical protein
LYGRTIGGVGQNGAVMRGKGADGRRKSPSGFYRIKNFSWFVSRGLDVDECVIFLFPGSHKGAFKGYTFLLTGFGVLTGI